MRHLAISTLSAAFFLAAIAVPGAMIGAGTGCGSDSDTVGTNDAGQTFILSIRPSTSTKTVGETQAFEAVITPSNAGAIDRVTWESSAPAVASIDGKGLASALTVGTTTITAHLDDATATASFTVVAKPDGSAPDGGDAGGGPQLLYVASLGGEAAPSIRVFALDAKDDATPVRSIVGASTKLGSPSQMAVVGSELFVADGNKYVLVFDVTASGDVAPKRTIEGSNTGFTNFSPTGVLGIGTELFVSDQQGGIYVFPTTATGNVAPTRIIESGASKHLATGPIANEVLVATGSEVRGYLKTVTGADPASLRTLTPTQPGARGVFATSTGIFVSTTGTMTGSSPDDAIVVYDATAQTGANPIRTIAGTANTGLDQPHGLAVTKGEIFVANQGDSSVRVWDENATGDVAPKRTIKGASTGLSFPAGILLVNAQ